MSQSLLGRQLRLARVSPLVQRSAVRYLANAAPKTTPVVKHEPSTSAATPAQATQAPPQQRWTSRLILGNPTSRRLFFKLVTFMGYNNSKQAALRRTIALYETCCVPRAEQEHAFWQQECHMPPTFQSWFLVTNLHVWLMTVRLRALQKPHGKEHIQGLIDTFFEDVEDRIRAVLQPGPAPKAYSYPSSPFYVNPNHGANTPDGKKVRKAPERLVTQQMKIFREQWAGMGIAMDLGLARGDVDMAGAVWRNLLGSRGARGIVFTQPPGEKPYYRRTVNLAGGEVVDVKKLLKRGLEKEEATDDLSGVHDYAPSEADKYVKYPELMETIITYVRRELTRLDAISDEELLGPRQFNMDKQGLEKFAFGPIRTQAQLTELATENLPVGLKSTPPAKPTPTKQTPLAGKKAPPVAPAKPTPSKRVKSKK